MLSVHVDDQLIACNSRSAMHSSTRSTTDSSALTLDRPDTSLASTSIEIDRHASFIYLNNITLRQYLTDLTWLIAILHGVRALEYVIKCLL